MAKTVWGLIALAVMTGTAGAQAPAPEQPPTAEQPSPSDQEALLDQLIQKAQEEAPSIETVARGSWRRFRRSISVGPTAGLWSGAIIDPHNVDVALTFGVGFEKFKVPVLPSMDTLQDLIVERIKAQAKDRLKSLLMGRPIEPVELERMVKQVYEDVRKEVLGLENIRGKTMERPAYNVAVEANRLFIAERWLGRVRAGIGIWKFTVGASFAFGRVCRSETCDDGIKIFLGPEVVLHLMTSKDPRASVFDVFFRGDFQANSRGMETYDHATLGVRYLLDII